MSGISIFTVMCFINQNNAWPALRQYPSISMEGLKKKMGRITVMTAGLWFEHGMSIQEAGVLPP